MPFKLATGGLNVHRIGQHKGVIQCTALAPFDADQRLRTTRLGGWTIARVNSMKRSRRAKAEAPASAAVAERSAGIQQLGDDLLGRVLLLLPQGQR